MSERTIFLDALERPHGPEREAYVDQACTGDAVLRQKVAALLKSHDEASGFLEQPALEQLGTQAEPGKTDTQDLSFLAASTKAGCLGTLGHYEIQETIGSGGYGVVLQAFDQKLHRVVAIKVLSPAFAANGAARRRFIREARTAAAVKNEHVVAIHGVQDEAQPPYLVMELIDGISLQDKIDRKGPLSLAEILRIGLQTAEGLAAAHSQGLVHRDIKPANILLENGVERVKITAFGLARAVDDASVTQSGTVAGTPMYMSPEQAEGLPVDHRSDLFSLGTVLYAMCTGHPPFRASGTHAVLKRVIEASPRPIRELNLEIPEWLCAIIAKLHARKPEDRFQTANEVAELLGQRLADVQAGRAEPRKRPVEAVVTTTGAVPVTATPVAPASLWQRLLLVLGIGTCAAVLVSGLLLGLCAWIPTPPLFVLGPTAAVSLVLALFVGTGSLAARSSMRRAPGMTAACCFLTGLALAALTFGPPGAMANVFVACADPEVRIRIKGLFIDQEVEAGQHHFVPAGDFEVIAEKNGKVYFTKKMNLFPSSGTGVAIPAFRTLPPLAVAPFDAAKAKAQQEAWAKHLGVPVEFENSIGMKLILIPPTGNALSKAYYLGKYEVTQKEWQQVMGYNPSMFGGKTGENPSSPAEQVSWYDCVDYCNKLSVRQGVKAYYEMTVKKRSGEDDKQIEEADVKILGGSGYHIPTEAEWDHGCLAGTKTKYHFGNDDKEMPEYGWFLDNSERRTHPVGQKKPNAFGLYDMHGNVREWNLEGVLRGGSWNTAPAGNCAVSFRIRSGLGSRTYAASGAGHGLRVARVALGGTK